MRVQRRLMLAACFLCGLVFSLGLVPTVFGQTSDDLPAYVFDAERDRALETFLKNATFQLYAPDGSPGCTGFNIVETKYGAIVFASAGHCTQHSSVDLSGQYVETPLYAFSLIEPLDFLISVKWKTEVRSEFVLLGNNEELALGTFYYTLGRSQFSPASFRCLTILRYTGKSEKGYLAFERMWGCELPQGTSGTPIINAKKELIGIYRGYLEAPQGEWAATEYHATDPRPIFNELQKK